jgi:hypothetical protein
VRTTKALTQVPQILKAIAADDNQRVVSAAIVVVSAESAFPFGGLR